MVAEIDALLEFPAGIPDNARTVVVVPTLLTSVPAVTGLIEHIEVLALGNLDPRIQTDDPIVYAVKDWVCWLVIAGTGLLFVLASTGPAPTW